MNANYEMLMSEEKKKDRKNIRFMQILLVSLSSIVGTLYVALSLAYPAPVETNLFLGFIFTFLFLYIPGTLLFFATGFGGKKEKEQRVSKLLRIHEYFTEKNETVKNIKQETNTTVFGAPRPFFYRVETDKSEYWIELFPDSISVFSKTIEKDELQ